MAIREVLTSFTFEQQRQMINLIGADVGDASTLLTPTNVLVSGINEIVNGDVDLVNQTHGMDDGTSGSPSLYWDSGQGFYKVDANKIALTTSLSITGNLEVDGNITFRAGSGSGGTLTFGDLDTDNIVFNADVQSSIVPDTTANYNLGTLAKQWNNLWIDGTASIDTLEVDDNSTFTGYLQVDSGDIRVPSTTTTVDLFDDYATTVEAFGAGTSIRIGDTSGTLTLRNPTLVGTETTQNVYNTVATTVNAFGAATNITMGVGGGGGNTNFNILSDDVVCSGDMNINGGELLSSSNTFDLLINNTDVRIGAAGGGGNTIINNGLQLKGNVNCDKSNGTFVYLQDNVEHAFSIRENTNQYMQFRTSDGFERVVIWKDLYVVGNLDISGTTTTIDTTNLVVEDKNIELGASSVPSDALADGGGITLKGTTDKTITYNNTDTVWETNIGLKVDGIVQSSLLVNTNNTPTAGEGIEMFYDPGATGGAAGGIQAYDRDGAALTRLKIRSSNWEILNDGDATFATITDSIGSLRRVGIDNVTGVSGIIGTSAAGKLLRVSSSNITLTIPQNTYTAGDMITFFNVSATNLTIEQGTGTTIYNAADGATGNRTVAAKGLATLVCTASNEFVISGTQLT